MLRKHWQKWLAIALLSLSATACQGLQGMRAPAPETLPPLQTLQITTTAPPVPVAAPAPNVSDTPLPINLPTALQLAGVRPLDIEVASERIQVALAQEDRARVLWLPTIQLGADYFRHDGQIQDVAGNVFGTSKGALFAGVSPTAVFAITDAVCGPLAARHERRAREHGLQAVKNDTLLAVAEAYFNVQQAQGELAGAEDAARRAEDLLKRTTALAKGLVAPVDEVRARTELARRRQAVESAGERWRTASADLTRILRLDAAAVVQPLEPPHLRVTLIPTDRTVDELLPVALTNRPELAAQQALVQATLERIRQERLRPWIPSVLVRGAATNPAGTLGAGLFGGGINDSLNNFSARFDCDVQLLWEFQNLGFGNVARVSERRAENRLALLELVHTQDRIAAEVVQTHAQVQSAAARLEQAEREVKDAADTVDKHFEGLEQPQKVNNVLVLLVRPQEAVAAIQALAQAYNDFYGAVADYDRAQFRLYRALGHPAQAVTAQSGDCPVPIPEPGARPDTSD